ncbi:MAG: WGR domain-containing protein [Bacteroidota bacterium]
MKTIEQIKLFFQDEKSDKIYEVDLCEVGDDLYVVNFRYGRRGANLREGTKTVFPVPYDEAKRAYLKLVKSKTKKGYREEGQAATSEHVDDTPVLIADGADSRKDTILNYLKEIASGSYTGSWKVSRIIWKAGELNIKDAAEYIRPFLKSGNNYESYSAIWALGRVDDNTSIEGLLRIYKNTSWSHKYNRIAAAVLLRICNKESEAFNTVSQTLKREIGPEWASIINNKDESLTSSAILDFLFGKSTEQADLLSRLYLLSFSQEWLKPHLQFALSKVPLKPGFFKSVRHIYKLAEFWNDGETYGKLSARIATASFNFSSGWGYTYVDGKYFKIHEEIVKSDSRLAFSDKTQMYLIKRAYRTALAGIFSTGTSYISLAKSVLLGINDKQDKQTKSIITNGSYRRVEGRWEYIVTRTCYPKYSGFPLYLYILYGNSTRFEPNNSRTKWLYLEGEEEKNELEIPREEAKPELWDNHPEQLIEVLAGSECEEVSNFAIKVFNANPDFKSLVTLEVLLQLLKKDYKPLSDLGVKLAEEQFDPNNHNVELTTTLLLSGNDTAFTLGKSWVDQNQSIYIQDSNFIQSLLFSRQLPVIDLLIKFNEDGVLENAKINGVNFEVLNGFFHKSTEEDHVFIRQMANLLINSPLSNGFDHYSPESLGKFLDTDSTIKLFFGGVLIRINKASTYELSKDFLNTFLDSENADVRKIGVDFLSDYPHSFLSENKELIINHCFSPFAEVREAVGPVVEKLIGSDLSFRTHLLDALITALNEKETFEGIHESHISLLNQYFGKELLNLSREQAFQLVLSKYESAQILGEQIFRDTLRMEDLSAEEVVMLSNSDIKFIRDKVIEYCYQNDAKVKYDLEGHTGIFNSDWEDIRRDFMEFLSKHTTDRDWTMDTLLFVCDNVKPDVQSFARSIVSKVFKTEYGLELLEKLAEHPSGNMLLYASNYLDGYAKDKPEVILRLEHYFKTILMSVNRNSALKQRAFRFLENESKKDPSVAKMTAGILSNILMTNAKGDKSKSIEILLTISEVFPEVITPVKVLDNSSSHAV